MFDIQKLLNCIDAYRVAEGGLAENTASGRIFGDRKKITALRSGADITTSRYNGALRWLADHWPVDQTVPDDVREVFDALAVPEGDAA